MLPTAFEAICKIYFKNIRTLIYIYDSKLRHFVEREIKNGIPEEEKPEKPNQPKSIYQDILETTIKKWQRKLLNDKNFIVNRSIA